MSKVYLHRPAAADKLLGRVEGNGDVYGTYPGPDDKIGQVDCDTGKVIAQRLGPNEYIGRVDLHNGKVYRHVPRGPDEYLGQVKENSRLDYHLPGQADEYTSRIGTDATLAEACAAFPLLVWPAFAEFRY
jgi:hypothetical protein